MKHGFHFWFSSICTGLFLCNFASGLAVCQSSGTIDPTQPPFNAVFDAKIGMDGSVTAGSSLLSSTHQSCSSSDVSKLAIFETSGAYPFGTGLVTVTGCNGSSWVLSTNATASGGGNFAIGTANGLPLSSAFSAAVKAGKILALPCGSAIVETPPFIFPSPPATVDLIRQRPDIQGCDAAGDTAFILHPNIMSVVTNGNIFFAYSPSAAPGSPNYEGLAGYAKIENIFLTSISGQLPTANGQPNPQYQIINMGSGTVRGIAMQGVGFQGGGAVNCVICPSGECHAHTLNFQNFTTPTDGTAVAITGVTLQGQGANLVEDSIFAFQGISVAINCFSFCHSVHNYIVQTQRGIQAFPGSTLVVVGSTIGVVGGSGSQGAVFDNGGAATIDVYGSQIVTMEPSGPAVTIGSSGSILNLRDSQLTSVASGLNIIGSGQFNDLGGSTFSFCPPPPGTPCSASALTQFTGGVNPAGGGSMSTAQTTAATNFGTAIGSTNLVPNVLYTAPMSVYVGTRQVTAGSGCVGGSSTAQITIGYTAPGGTAQTITATALTISGNGMVDSGSTAAQVISFTPKGGTAVTYSVLSTPNPTGCGTVPQYVVDLRVQ